MRKIVYYVATSIDGFISGPDDDISLFVQKGPVVEQYLQDLQLFDTVIMGRKTYEFGYKFGLEPGQPAYPHMEHFIFSSTLSFNNPHPKVHIKKLGLDTIADLKKTTGSDVYLCGGGQFAGWLLDHGLIDILKIKLNPILFGEGVAVFGSSKTRCKLKIVDRISFDDGIQILTYQVGP